MAAVIVAEEGAEVIIPMVRAVQMWKGTQAVSIRFPFAHPTGLAGLLYQEIPFLFIALRLAAAIAGAPMHRVL